MAAAGVETRAPTEKPSLAARPGWSFETVVAARRQGQPCPSKDPRTLQIDHQDQVRRDEPMTRRNFETHSRMVVAINTRVLQSHIHTSNAISSTTPPDKDRRRAGLDLTVDGLESADKVFSFREDGRRHNLVG